ncbi:MAG: hypothetical protein M3463_08045, partial [Verrucomicrobiota bacterium]|nr:hypothetical protein [Verrucomicrobiota bacterium]
MYSTDKAPSPDHPVGGHKALLFERVLGLTAADARTALGDNRHRYNSLRVDRPFHRRLSSPDYLLRA